MKGCGELVLYIGIGGVLHHDYEYRAPLFEWSHFLVDALEPYPGVRLVLSSSWCLSPGYNRTLKRLPEQLRHRFVGGTFHRRHHGADPGADKSFAALPRGVQILADVLLRQPCDWLAVDDDDLGWPVWPTSLRGHLLLCDGPLGLSKPETMAELRDRLALMAEVEP
jgi:hypothetical protein